MDLNFWDFVFLDVATVFLGAVTVSLGDSTVCVGGTLGVWAQPSPIRKKRGQNFLRVCFIKIYNGKVAPS
jgi:hypothetical protein